jgi:transcriptional regulator with XRE-family HTH domain
VARTKEQDVASDPEQPGTELERLDIAQLGQLLRERRGSLSIRQAAAEAGVSFSTFSRVEGGAHPDLATFTRLCAWLGVSPAKFFTPIVERELSPLEEAITHLRADPRLTPENAGRISTMLTELYGALARDVAPQPVVACHLRASSVMRPGVPERLASALREMHDELENLVDAGVL